MVLWMRLPVVAPPSQAAFSFDPANASYVAAAMTFPAMSFADYVSGISNSLPNTLVILLSRAARVSLGNVVILGVYASPLSTLHLVQGLIVNLQVIFVAALINRRWVYFNATFSVQPTIAERQSNLPAKNLYVVQRIDSACDSWPVQNLERKPPDRKQIPAVYVV